MGLDYLFEGTVDGIVEFEGAKFIGKGNSTIRVHPAESGGVRFRTGHGEFPVDSDHLQAHKMGFSHILVATHRPVQKPRWKDIAVLVPEHFLSALSLAGINNAVVDVGGRVIESGDRVPWIARGVFARSGLIPKRWDARSLPIMDGTASEFYNVLSKCRMELGKPLTIYEVTDTFHSQNKAGSVLAAPSSNFSICVNAMSGDKYGLSPHSLEITDVYGSIREHVAARALSRPPKWKDYVPGIKSTEDFFSGFLESSYLTIDPREPLERKKAKMQEQYRAERNEPFAHMVFSDMPGEMSAFWPGNVRGHFVFDRMGGGHTGRMLAYREMFEEGVLERVA